MRIDRMLYMLSIAERKILITLTKEFNSCNILWMCTRTIANICDMNIYQTRYCLLKLFDKGFVFRRKKGRQKIYWSLRELG